MSGSGYTCVRRCFCCFNLLFWVTYFLMTVLLNFIIFRNHLVTGCSITAVGLWLKFNYETEYMTLMPKYAMFTADWITIVLGATIMVLSFLGYCGSWIQVRFLLILYFLMVIFIFMIQFAVGTMALTFSEQISKTLRDDLLDSLEKHRNSTIENKHGARILIWDHIQSKLQCCGVQDYTDWYAIDGIRTVPDSCCKTQTVGCGQILDQDNWYDDGCSTKIHQWILRRIHFVSLAVFVIAFLQFFGLITSMLIACTISHRKQQHYENTRRAIKAVT